MPVEVKDALMIMLGFGTFTIVLVTLVVYIIMAINQRKEK